MKVPSPTIPWLLSKTFRNKKRRTKSEQLEQYWHNSNIFIQIKLWKSKSLEAMEKNGQLKQQKTISDHRNIFTGSTVIGKIRKAFLCYKIKVHIQWQTKRTHTGHKFTNTPHMPRVCDNGGGGGHRTFYDQIRNIPMKINLCGQFVSPKGNPYHFVWSLIIDHEVLEDSDRGGRGEGGERLCPVKLGNGRTCCLGKSETLSPTLHAHIHHAWHAHRSTHNVQSEAHMILTKYFDITL